MKKDAFELWKKIDHFKFSATSFFFLHIRSSRSVSITFPRSPRSFARGNWYRSDVYFAAVFGNPLVIYVINKDFRLHTVTSTFIYNLALTDITTATTYMPFWMVTLYTGTWNVSQLWCQLSKSILTTTCYTSLNYGVNGPKSVHYRCKTCTVQKSFLQQKSS